MRTFLKSVFLGLCTLLTLTHGDSYITPNQCVSFSVSSGTGCAWMCSYCANQLGTNNYYFTDNVCTYEQGVGCVGNPLAGKTYTCCAASQSLPKNKKEKKEKKMKKNKVEKEDL